MNPYLTNAILNEGDQLLKQRKKLYLNYNMRTFLSPHHHTSPYITLDINS